MATVTTEATTTSAHDAGSISDIPELLARTVREVLATTTQDGTPLDPDRLLSPDDLAVRWGVTRQSIYRYMQEGLPSLKLGRARRIRVSAADAWLESRQGGDTA